MMMSQDRLSKIAVVSLLLLLPLRPAVGMELDAIAELARQGAPQLALKLIQQHQPDFQTQAAQWYEWESRRLQILESRGDWQGIIARAGQYPQDLDAAYAQWAEELQVKAYLELGQGAEARRHLRHLIWEESIPGAPALQRYRDLVIRSYMVDSLIDPAQLAMLRYQQDYRDLAPSALVLRAEVLLAARRYDEAISVLASVKTEEARVLAILARLRQTHSLKEKDRRKLRWLGSQVSLPRRVHYLAWSAQAELAQMEGNDQAAILALERALVLQPQHIAVPFVVTDARQLWQLYDHLAEQLGNRKRLLQGDDRAWLKLAKKSLKKEPLQARALYAHLARQASRPANRALAHDRLIEQLLLLPQGEDLLERVYRPLFQDQLIDNLPLKVRYFFADRALSRGDLDAASRYLARLDHAPEGADNVAWNLRRARILIMAGKVDSGVEVLRAQLHGKQPLQGQNLDRFMQVVFDLQTVKAHAAAIELFTTLLQQSKSLKLQRELHFWLADSYRALGQLETAATHYLKSAALSSADGEGQLWAQSAKYQAARTLADVGLYEDARTLYLQLLHATDDTKRKAVLRHEMQTLGLKQVQSSETGG
jgi:tetratricopeptide (TPR) repeat protein